MNLIQLKKNSILIQQKLFNNLTRVGSTGIQLLRLSIKKWGFLDKYFSNLNLDDEGPKPRKLKRLIMMNDRLNFSQSQPQDSERTLEKLTKWKKKAEETTRRSRDIQL